MLNKPFSFRISTRGALLLTGVLLSCWCSSPRDTLPELRDLPFQISGDAGEELLIVNGEPVERQLILLLGQIKRPELIRRMKGVVETEPGPEFWDQPVENVTPRAELTRLTLIESVEVKVRLLLARDFGIRGEVDFENVKRRWQVENLRRKEAVERGDEIFGPLEYSFPEFFENDMRSLDVALMQRLWEEELLEQVDSIWDRQPGESRLERMQRLFRTYIAAQVQEAAVQVNTQQLLSLDLVAGEPAS